MAYEYDYLQPGWIRLLHIVSITSEIVLRVGKVSLESEPSYLALSYCWGAPPSTGRVSLETGWIDVRPNLLNALQKMDQYVGAKIWIDAICINQQDDEEKSHQVQAMDRVYRQSDSVLIWLGGEADDSDIALRGIRAYGGAAFDAGILDFATPQFQAWPDLSEYPEHHEARDELLRLMQKATETEGDATRAEERVPRVALAKLSRREYFTRVWVKQEVTLAPNAIILCGNESVALEHLHAMILFYGLLQMWEVVEWRAGRSTRIPGPFSEEELMSASNPNHLLATTNASDAIGGLFLGRKKYRSNGPEPLYNLLYSSYVRPSSRVLCCMDPRDKIWGLVGIASDVDELLGLGISYERSVEDVYETTARGLLRQGQIEILSWCRSKEKKLPTWVPDLSLPIRQTWSNDSGKPLFKASGEKQQPEAPESKVVQGMVRLHGLEVDVLNQFGSTWRADPDASFDQQSFLHIAQHVANFLDKSRYSEDQKRDALWRIPIGDKEFLDTNPYYVRGTERSANQFRSLISNAMNPDLMASTYSYQTCMSYNYMAKPLLTKDGYVGLGPSDMKDGDLVALFWGGSTPYIVRPREDQKGYTLVGEAYLYGIMDGELVQHLESSTVFELW